VLGYDRQSEGIRDQHRRSDSEIGQPSALANVGQWSAEQHSRDIGKAAKKDDDCHSGQRDTCEITMAR